MKKTFLCILIALISSPALLLANVLEIQTDNDWFPYTYENSGKSVGIHVDIVEEALKMLGYKYKLTPIPWKRCLKNLEYGNVEAVLSASYNDERVEFAYYPDDAATATKSTWRIDQVEYVLVTRKGDPFEFDGDFSKIPQPVNVAIGAAIGSYLREKGIDVKESGKNRANVAMLLADRTASIAMNPLLAEDFNTNGEFAGSLKIHQIPLRSKSYFLIFSKSGMLSASERTRIWGAISRIREDKKLMLNILHRYEEESALKKR